MKTRLRGGPIIVVLVLTLLLILQPINTVDAGPLQTFASSPIPYWQDTSAGVPISWSPTDQTIRFSESMDSDFDGIDCWSESFADVSEWTPTGAGTITTDGDIATYTGNGAAGRYVEAEFDAISVNNYLTMYSIAGTAADFAVYLEHDNTDWHDLWGYGAHFGLKTTLISSDPDFTTGTVTGIRVYVWNDGETMKMDYLRIGDPELDIDVPITRADRQAVTFMVNTTNLDSEVYVQAYDNTTASGVICSFNSTHVNFPSAGITGNAYAEINTFARITFTLSDQDHTYRIDVQHLNNSWENYWVSYMERAYNNFLKFYDGSFDGEFVMYYLDGDTDYRVWYDTPEWIKTGTQDPAVSQHQQGMLTNVENDQLNHDITYSTDVPYLGYLRTEFFWGWDLAIDPASCWRWNITIDIGIYQIYFEYNATFGDDYEYTTVRVSNTTYDFYNLVTMKSLAEDQGLAIGKVMFWRTQEDNIGIMFWGSYNGNYAAESNLFTEGFAWSDPLQGWKDVAGENETIWISDFAIEYWNDTSISLGYFIDSNAATDDWWIEFQYNYFEYQYYMPSGVVQPHFSSTYWDGHSSPWWQWLYENGQVDGDVYAPNPEEEPEDVDIFAQILANFNIFGNSFRDSLIQIGNNVGRILGNVADTLIGLGNTVISIVAITFINVMNTFLPGLGTGASNVITGLIGGIGTIFSGIVFFFSMFLTLIGYIASAINWITIYFVNARMAQIILIIMVALPVLSFSGMNIFGKGTGYNGALAWCLAYIGIGLSILSLAWRLLSGVLNVIGNFLPFT